jgi:hypothetical protein
VKDPDEVLTKHVGGVITEGEYEALKEQTDKKAVNISRLIRLLLREWTEKQRESA